MKKIKRMMAIAIAIILTLGVSNFVFAADPSTPTTQASITINSKAPAGTTETTAYNAYEILKASIGTGGAVSYYLPASSTTLKEKLDAVTITKNGSPIDVFTFTPSADGTRFNVTVNSAIESTDGEALATALNTNDIKDNAVSTKHFAQTTAGGSATSGEVDPGYYLVTSSLGTKLVLQTLNNVTIDTKNDYITNTKTASKTNMEVGDKVTYTITVNLPATTAVGDTVTVHDTLDSHLAILDAQDAIAASAADYNITAKYGANDTAVTLTNGTLGTGETFAKQFTVTQDMITAGSVTLTYKAELLSTAADDTGYVNDAFSNTSAYETLPSEVKVYTFDITVDKTFTGVAAGSESNYKAKFELRKAADGEGLLFIHDTTGYVLADSDDALSSKVLEATGGPAINIRGLAAGTYYLVETATAEGFNMLADPVVITITDTTTGTQPNITPSHTVSYKVGNDGTAADGTSGIEVVNNTGAELPSTGGSGTTMIYIIGVILLAGAGILLVTRRRMKAE